MNKCIECGSLPAQRVSDWNFETLEYDIRLCESCWRREFNKAHVKSILDSKRVERSVSLRWAEEIVSNYPKALLILNEQT